MVKPFLVMLLFVLLTMASFSLFNVGYVCGPSNRLLTYFLMSKIKLNISEYEFDCKHSPQNLKLLIASKESCWLGPYLREKDLIDRFGNAFIFDNQIQNIISVGKDGVFNTEDDMTSIDNESKRLKMKRVYSSENNSNNRYLISMFYLFLSLVTIIVIKIFDSYKNDKKKRN